MDLGMLTDDGNKQINNIIKQFVTRYNSEKFIKWNDIMSHIKRFSDDNSGLYDEALVYVVRKNIYDSLLNYMKEDKIIMEDYII